MFRQMLSCVCVYEYESVGECVSEYKHLCIYTLAHMQELIFEGFASSLGRYFFPPAREGEPEGWALLDAEHQRWRRLRASIRDQAVSEHALMRQVRGGEEGGGGRGERGRGDLPQGLMTAICVKFRMVPGPATAELRSRS